MRILILCTGNSCRSQMAEGFLKSFDSRLMAFSAGTKPASCVNPKSVQVMKEAGIDISQHTPDNVNIYSNQPFDYVISVCDSARELCPVFTEKVKNNIHHSFEDPWEAKGSDEEVLAVYRKVRDQIKDWFFDLYNKEMKENL